MIELGGQMRPIEFSTKVAYDFERLTGKSYLTEIDELIRDIARVGAANAGKGKKSLDVGLAVAQMSVVRFVDITFAALVYAHSVQRTPIDFTQRDVAGWLLADNFAPAWPVANLIIDSLPQVKPGEAMPEPAKKKALTGSTGTSGDAPQPTPE